VARPAPGGGVRRVEPGPRRAVRLRVLPALGLDPAGDGEARFEYEASKIPHNPEMLGVPAPAGLATYLERLLNEVRSH
jgi:hypothetical protein